MRAGLADEFAANPAGFATPGKVASPTHALIYDERVGSLLGLYASRDRRASVRASHVCRAAAPRATSFEPFDGRSGAEPPPSPIALSLASVIAYSRAARAPAKRTVVAVWA